jgi:superfamily I DNA/RNA helicase
MEKQILKVVEIRQPILAREITTILQKEFNLNKSKSEINSVLFRLKNKGVVRQNNEYKWSLAKQPSVENRQSQQNSSRQKVINDQTIKLDITQKQIVDFDLNGHLLVRGQAGSGKTTVLAARAGRVISIYNTGKILFLTYNTALCDYVKKSFRKSGISAGQAKVINFHQWCSSVARELRYHHRGWVDGKKREEKIREIILGLTKEGKSHRLYNLEDNKIMQWWGDEIAWIFGQAIPSYWEYENAERTGRGNAIRVTKTDRQFIWLVYFPYCQWLDETDQVDYDNPDGLIKRALKRSGNQYPERLLWDHVFVDEVQDFDKSWLIQVVQVAKSSLSLAGDLHQRIYKRNFSWRAVGIQIQGSRSRKLDNSFRTTRKIMKTALQVMEPVKLVDHEDYIEPNMPRKEGEPIVIIEESNAQMAFSRGYDYIAEKFRSLRSKSIAIALPFNNQTYEANRQLQRRNVNAQVVRGDDLGQFEQGVAVTTYHQLKGLEFDHVVLMGLGDDIIPGKFLDRVAEEDIEFELNVLRSLVYVGMTRAKETVTLVCHNPISRLLSNIDRDLLVEWN